MRKQKRFEKLKEGEILILDGPMGTELQRRGISLDGPSWSAQALLSNPDNILSIYKEYVDAGADILTTNTFRTHERNLVGTKLENQGEELTSLAVELTQQIAKDNQLVAGSLSPLGDCYQIHSASKDEKQLFKEHRQQAKRLVESGVDLILAETFGTIYEAAIALRSGLETGLPTWISFVCGADGKLLSGESVTDAIQLMSTIGCHAFLLNCSPAPEALSQLQEFSLVNKSRNKDIPFGVYANTGRMVISDSNETTWESTEAEAPEVYAECAKSWIAEGATIIGGCCGTTPDHIRILKEKILS